MQKAIIRWMMILLIAVLIIICMYFYKFNDGLSENQNDWAAFGGYLGGIAAILNVGVFIWLTIAIQNAGEAQKKIELQYQKKLLIAQFQKSEIEKLQRLTSLILEKKGDDRFNSIVTLKYILLDLEFSNNSILTTKSSKLSDKVCFRYTDIIEYLATIEKYHNKEIEGDQASSAFANFSIQMNAFIEGLQRKLLIDIDIQ